jgi:hypothetical protein
MTLALLILHGLTAVVLLGALTHQLAALLRGNAVAAAGKPASKSSFIGRYVAVGQGGFTIVIVMSYVVSVVLGGIIYPTYRVDVRIPFEEMSLIWAIGLFEMKEHWGGVGLGFLPLYAYVWRPQQAASHHRDRVVITALLATIVWCDFIVGHILNNIRGL